MDCGFSSQPPWRGGSNVYTQSNNHVFGGKIKLTFFPTKCSIFTAEKNKFIFILPGQVFVMNGSGNN